MKNDKEKKALRRSGLDYISNNSLSVFRTCSHKFKLNYRDDIKPIKTKLSLFIGKIAHSALEYYYSKKVTPDQAIQFFVSEFESGLIKEDVDLGSKFKTPEEARDYGVKLLDTYFMKYDAGIRNGGSQDDLIDLAVGGDDADNFEVLATEIKFNISFDLGHDEQIELTGIIDLIGRDREGKIFIMDHKLMAQKFDSDYLDFDNQITTYFVGAKSLGFEVDYAVYNVIYKYTKPVCTRYFVERSEEVIEDWRQNVVETVRAIQTGTTFKNISKNCSWCDYIDLCFNKAPENFIYGVDNVKTSMDNITKMKKGGKNLDIK